MDVKLSCLVPALIAFALSAALGWIAIPVLKRIHFGQFVRDDGPESHLKKAGTPTMGGVVFILAFVITSVFYIKDYPNIVPVLLSTFGFGVVGFIDDFIKIGLKRSLGLTPLQKMLGLFLVAVLVLFYLMYATDIDTVVKIPFMAKEVDLKWFYFVLYFLMVLGTVNGANFTDGLDGLASSVTAVIAVFFTVGSVLYKTGMEPATCALFGALMGFLFYNTNPAKMFMGDTGSLALGGFVASCGLMLRQPFLIIIVAFFYLIEVISVIIQVASYKLTGKRVFRMAPIHHHFELGGWAETRVVAMFTMVTVILCIIAGIAL